jgi:hypothetical protein
VAGLTQEEEPGRREEEGTAGQGLQLESERNKDQGDAAGALVDVSELQQGPWTALQDTAGHELSELLDFEQTRHLQELDGLFGRQV